MNDQMSGGMREALELTRAGRLTEATAMLQNALGNTTTTFQQAPTTPSAPSGGLWQTLKHALGRLKPGHAPAPQQDGEPAVGGRFLTGSYTGPAGTRSYRLYVPTGAHGQPLPLVVMLHGCTQSPEDFATGTQMNRLAEQHTCLVVYPAQDRQANPQGCWNWFDPNHQRRDQGEPSLVAGIVRQVMAEQAVDPRRVYIAGLSAGGAAALVLGMTYPDLFAAVGVHSGLAYASAKDVPSAFAAMQQATPGDTKAPLQLPLIVFQGDKDRTVSPRNADRVLAQAGIAGLTATIEQGQAPGGQSYTRTVYADGTGADRVEDWRVKGAGHAWSGGNSGGTYTDPQGPNASAEMLRFFLAQTRG